MAGLGMNFVSLLSIIVLLAALTLFFSIWSSSSSTSSLNGSSSLQETKGNFRKIGPYHMSPREQKAVQELVTALSYVDDPLRHPAPAVISAVRDRYADERETAERIAELLEDAEQGQRYSESGLRRAREEKADKDAQKKLMRGAQTIAQQLEQFINKNPLNSQSNSSALLRPPGQLGADTTRDVAAATPVAHWSEEFLEQSDIQQLETNLLRSARRQISDWPYCGANPKMCAEADHDRTMYEKRAKRLTTLYPANDSGKQCNAPVKLFLEGRVHEWWGHILGPVMNSLHECPTKCQITQSTVDANVQVSLMDISAMKRPEQKSAVISIESFKGYGGHPITDQIAQQADFIVNFNRNSDVPVNYFYGLVGDNGERTCDAKAANRPANQPPCLPDAFPPQWDKFNDSYDASLFVGNCVDGRADYLRELLSSLKVASYGRCLQTPGIKQEGGYAAKVRLASQYKFHLAFENVPLWDYVTEKFWNAFQAGIIPVYWGAPNIEEFAPGYNSFINALNFESPKHLSAYLQQVASNRTLYESYFQWRKYPPRQEFLQLIEDNFTQKGKYSWVCRICHRYEQRFCRT